MDMSLFDMVATESYSPDMYDGEFNGLDYAAEADIDAVITDDPTTVFAYTSGCMENMLALEAAEAKMEGLMSVQLMNARAAGDEAAMEETVVTMEGFLGNVWEALKELVVKAYTAIKNFLIKAWNKFKGYANVVKAFFGKYGEVLRSKRVPGCMVKWTEIRVLGGEQVFHQYYSIIQNSLVALAKKRVEHAAVHAIDKIANHPDPYNAAYQHDRVIGAGMRQERFLRRAPSVAVAHNPATGQTAIGIDRGGIPSPHEINVELSKAIYPRGEEMYEVGFEAIRRQAIEAADISTYKKYIDNFLALGDKAHREALRIIEDAKRAHAETREISRSMGVSTIHSGMRRCLNAQIELHRLCMHGMYTAAKRMQSQSIAACRKAIMFHATKGAGATYAGESYTPEYNTEYADGYDNSYENVGENASNDYFDGILSEMGY